MWDSKLNFPSIMYSKGIIDLTRRKTVCQVGFQLDNLSIIFMGLYDASVFLASSAHMLSFLLNFALSFPLIHLQNSYSIKKMHSAD